MLIWNLTIIIKDGKEMCCSISVLDKCIFHPGIS